MKEPMLSENSIYTWSIKVLNLQDPTSARTMPGMATHPPAHGVSDFDSYDYRFKIKTISGFDIFLGHCFTDAGMAKSMDLQKEL